MTDHRAADSLDPTTDRPVGPPERLTANLGLFTAITIVVGGVIGSGVFLKPSQVAQATEGYVGLILALWIVCGLVSLCGALAMAELSAMFPRAGGSYVFLNEAYGPLWGFLWAWAEFSVMRSGAIASLAAAMAIGVNRIAETAGYQLSTAGDLAIAIGSVVGLAAVNIVGTRWGGVVQNVTTVIKALFVAFLAVLPFVAIGSQAVDLTPLWPDAVRVGLLMGIGKALSAILWAYDGWAQLPVIAEEVRNPQRNVPRALLIGLTLLIVLYTSANLAYHLALPSAVIADPSNKSPTAVMAAEKLMPNLGGKLTLSMMIVSVFGALNASILTGPRVLFAAARDHRALGPLRRVDPRFGTPAAAIAALSGWAIVLIIAALWYPNKDKRLYDVLTDYCIFGASIFYLASVVAVFVLRVRRPDAPRPYRALGYPVLPAVFVVAYVAILIAMLVASLFESLAGLSLIGLGALVYAIVVWFGRRPARAGSRNEPVP
jgi:basic amino acid/polyamine antiporter, APA family